MAVKPGDIVAVWGAGAVGQMAAVSAWQKGASRVIVIDEHDCRLSKAAMFNLVLNSSNVDMFSYMSTTSFPNRINSVSGLLWLISLKISASSNIPFFLMIVPKYNKRCRY